MGVKWMKWVGISAVVAMLFAAAAVPVRAQALVSTGESFLNARFLPGIPQNSGARLAGLRLTLKPGWKTYWRSPGEAGIPPQFDWSASDNLASARVLWPRPEIFQSFGMETIGYGGQVVLPILLVPTDPSRPMLISAIVDMGVCREICVLERFEFSERIWTDTPSIGTGQINRAVAKIPSIGAEAGLVLAECQVSGTGRVRDLKVALVFDQTLTAPKVLFEGTEDAWITKAQTQTDTDRVTASAKLHMSGKGGWFDRGSLRMTVLAEGFAAEVHGCTAPRG